MALLRHCLREVRVMQHDWNVPADAWPEADLRGFAWAAIRPNLARQPSSRPQELHRIRPDAHRAAS